MLILWFPKICLLLFSMNCYCRHCVMERIESDNLPLELHPKVEEMIRPPAETGTNGCTEKNVYGKVTVPSSSLNLCILINLKNNGFSPRV